MVGDAPAASALTLTPAPAPAPAGFMGLTIVMADSPDE